MDKEQILKKAEAAAAWAQAHPWKTATGVLATILVLVMFRGCAG